MVSKKNESRLARRVQRIKSIEKGTLASVVEIGRELIAAEAECEHGAWANWLRTNFSWSVRTALRYRTTADFCTACDNGAYGPDVTFGDMNISLSALYFVAKVDQAVAKSIAMKAIDTRVTLKVAKKIEALSKRGTVDLAKDEQRLAPTAEDDDAGLSRGDDGREADVGLAPGAEDPISVGLSLLADELDQNPENFIAAARAFDPARLRRILREFDRVLKAVLNEQTVKRKADRAEASQN